MCVLRLHRRPPSTTAVATFILLLLLFDSAASLTRSFGVGGGGDRREREKWGRVLRQGPGSSPPSCRSKCGRCAPCKAVHVLIKPGMSMPLEYYPEAWRCKCGDRLYMP